MKRLIYPSTASAVAWWAANPTAFKADCFSIALPTGQILYATEGQWDLTVPAALTPSGTAMTFAARQYGLWSRGKITSEAGFKLGANTMALSVAPLATATYPGLSITIQNAAFNHLFDGAQVWVWTAYMPFGQYGTVEVFETKFQGRIIRSPKIGRLVCQFDVADPLFLLNMKVPSTLFQSNCPWGFCDANCGLTASNYTLNFTAATVTQTTLTATSALSQPNGYFAQGVITCLTGQNSGLSQTVKTYTGGVLTTMVPWLLPVAPGDTFSVIKGCAKTPTACASTAYTNGTLEPTEWELRFRGTPYVPPPTNAL